MVLKEVKINRPFHMAIDKVKEKRCDEAYLLYRKKWNDYPKEFKLNEYPLHVDIETTNECNLRCPMCPRNFMKNKVGFMDINLFKKIIDEIGGKVSAIKLNWRGEPTMHPKLPEMIRYAKQKGIMEILINSNGTLLNDKLSEEIIKAGIDTITFSFDSYEKKKYEAIRIGANFEKTVENIKNFVKIRDGLGMKTPIVRIQMVNLKNDSEEVKKYIEFWKDIVDQVAYLDYIEWHKKVDGTYEIREGFVCAPLWQRILVTWDGSITCIGDSYVENPVGDANKENIIDVWRSKKLEIMRNCHRNGEYHKIPICKKCQMAC